MKIANGMPVIDDMGREQIEFYVRSVAEAGFDGIEPMLGDPRKLDRPMLQKLLESYGLELAGIRTGGIYNQLGLRYSHPDPAMRRKAVAALNHVIDFAAPFGCAVLVGQLQGKLEPGETLVDAKKWIAECLRENAEYAQTVGVSLSLEPITRYEMAYHNTARDVMKFLEPVNAGLDRKVMLLMDVFHMLLEEPSVTSDFIAARNMTGHVHFSSCTRDVPGTCEMDFAEYARVLTALGYDKYIALEILVADESTYACKAKQGLEYIKTLFTFARAGFA